MQEIASLYAAIGLDTTDFVRGLRGVDKDLNTLQKGMSGLQSAVGLGLKAAAGVGIAALGGITAGIGMAVNSAAEMEQQAANISAVFGSMAPPVEDVKGLINTLALDPSLVTGVNEAGAGIEMLAKNGLSWQEIADGAARSSILLSNATGADLATAADIATNAMSIFGLGVSDLDSVVATFVNSANQSQFGVEDWGYALANVGPKAAAFGFELDDLFAAMTMTSGAFASGQTMGTSWAWMINGLVPNTDKASDAMKELGLITADGANQFFNADGTGKSLTEVIGLLQGAFGGLTTEQQMAYSRTIFGQEAFGALSGVLGINNDELAQLIPQMTDFAAVEAGAATRTNTFKAVMDQMGDTMTSVKTMIGDAFLPVFTNLVRAFTGFVQSNAPAIQAWFAEFAAVLETVVGWLFSAATEGAVFNDAFSALPQPIQDAVTAIDSVVSTVSGFVAGMHEAFEPLIDFIAKHVEWSDVMTAVGVVLASIVIPAIASFVAAIAPVVATFAALVAASAALRTAWENDWLGIRTKTEEAVGYINESFGPLFATIEEFGGESLREISAWATGNKTEFTATQKIWKSTQETFGNVFGDMGEKLEEWSGKAWKEFKENFPTAADTLTGAFTDIRRSFDELWAVVKPLLDSAIETFNIFVSDWEVGSEDVSKALGIAKDVLDGVWSAMITITSTGIETMLDALKLVVQLLSGDFAGAWETAQGMVTNIVEGIRDVVTGAFSTITGALTAMGVDVTSEITALETMMQTFWSWLTGLSFGDTFTGIADGFAGIVDRLVNWVWPEFPEWNWPSIPTPDWLSNLWGSMPSWIPGRAGGGQSTFGGMTLVGERGPELVNLPAGSYVHTNTQSQAMMGTSGSLYITLDVRGDSNLPSDRAKLRELAIALQRELQLSGATTTRYALG